MKKTISILYSICILFTMSCNSNLSSEKIEAIDLIGSTIEINQNPTNHKENWMTINLFDKNSKMIRNDSIKVIVNNIENTLKHAEGLYYNDESNYYIENVPVNDVYKVEIKLSDGNKYFLGSINALAEVNEENIACNEVGNPNKDFVIKWHDLKAFDELSVRVGMKEKTEPNITSITSQEEKIVKINSSGSFTLPKTKYNEAKATINNVEFNFRTTRNGKINPALLAQSKITISTSIKKNVSFQ